MTVQEHSEHTVFVELASTG